MSQNPALLTAPAVAAPQTNRPRPLLTWRVVIRATGVALRRTDNIDLPAFGSPDLYRDQICEFPSEDTARLALEYVRLYTSIGHTLRASDSLVALPYIWDTLTDQQENAVLCRVRDSIAWLGWTQMRDAMTNVRRSLVGLNRRPS